MVDTENNIGINVGQTLETVGVLGDMLLAGRTMCLDALNKYPYIPDFFNLTDRVESVLGDRIDPETKNWFINFYLSPVYDLMEKRAALQREDPIKQAERKRLITHSFRRDLQLDLESDEFEIDWSLFSYAIIVREPQFAKIRRTLGVSGGAEGFVGGIIGDLGLIPVCQRSNSKSTKMHEDLHSFQGQLGELNAVYDWKKEIDNLGIEKLLETENTVPADLAVAQSFFNGVLVHVRQDIGIELRAYVWDKQIPQVSLDATKRNEVLTAADVLINVMYAPQLGMSDKEKVMGVYEIMLDIGRVNEYRNTLWAIVRQAVDQNRDKEKPWDWVASRLMVLPSMSSLKLIKAVLLGRKTELKNGFKVDTTLPLPQALITLVRRKLNPDSFGKGDMVEADQIDKFLQMAKEVFENRKLYGEIIDKYQITEEQMTEVRKNFIRYARVSVPAGFRGRIEKELKQRLVDF
jgi:hypothetical protein